MGGFALEKREKETFPIVLNKAQPTHLHLLDYKLYNIMQNKYESMKTPVLSKFDEFSKISVLDPLCFRKICDNFL